MASWQCFKGKGSDCPCPCCAPPEPPACTSPCFCPRCRGEQKHWYRVRPYDWASKPANRSGTSYSIEQVRMIATSKCLEDANLIVAALNGRKKMEAKIEALEGQLLVSLPQVRLAMVKEAAEHYGWLSHHRKQIVEFGNAVLRRLGYQDDIGRTSDQ